MKRAVAIAGYVVLALLAAVGLVLSAAYVVVSTDLGRGFLVPLLVRAADGALAGRIELKNFHLLPSGGVELIGLRVLDPGGDEVLRAERVSVYPDLSRLRSRSVGFRAQIDEPVVMLRREQDGSLSLTRAFAPARPTAAKAPSGPPTWTIRLPRLTVRNASVRYVDARGRTVFVAEDTSVDGRAAYGPRGARLELAARGTMAQPERAPLTVEIAGGLRGTELRVLRLRTFRLAVGDTGLDLVADLDTASWRGRAALLTLSADASQLHGAVPSVPLVGDVDGTAYAESDGAQATAAFELRAPRGGGSAEGAVAVRLPPAATAAGLEVQVAQLDLARLLYGAPSSNITLQARGRAAGQDLATLRGSLSLSLAPSSFRGGRIGRAEVRAAADHGAIDVAQLDVAVPGGTISARGRWSERGPLGGHAVLDGSNLALLGRNLALVTGRPLLPLAGSARVEASLSGTAAAPDITLHVESPRLAAGGATVSGLTLSATISGPLSSPHATIEGNAAAAAAGSLDVRAVSLAAGLQGRAGEVSLTGQVPGLGPDTLAVHAAGALSRDGHDLQLSTLTLSWPGDRFELQHPALVSLRDPSVDELALASGPQRVELSGGIRGRDRRRALDVHARLEAVDLALLPHALVPSTLGLAGRLGADVSVTGPESAPQVKGNVELTEAAAMGLTGLSGTARFGYQGGPRRVEVDVTVRRAGGGELDLRGDLPVLLSRAPPGARLTASVSARRWPAEELLRIMRVHTPEPLRGAVTVEAQLGGTRSAPTLHGDASVEEGRYGELEPFALTLRVDGAGSEVKLRGTADYRDQRALDLDARAPISIAALLRDPAAFGHRLPEVPLAITASVPGLDLASIAGRGDVPEDLSGQLIARAEVKGSIRSPRGSVSLAVANMGHAGYRGIDGEVSLAALDRSTTLHATLSRDGDLLARASASLGLAIEHLAHLRERGNAPLTARVEVPGIELQRAASGAPLPIAGHLAGHLDVAGTLSAPRIELDASGRQLEVGGHPLGELTVAAQADRALHASARLVVPTGGSLDTQLDADTGLGMDVVLSGRFRSAPARATLVASQLDLAFLPAVSAGRIRTASGKLQAQVTASGPLARMVPRGTASLSGGAVSVAELGEWTQVALEASLSEDVARLDRFSARRGDGTLLLTAVVKGLARRDAPADITGNLRTEGLTIPRAGQDLATVDVDAKITGKVSSRMLDAEISIPGATVKLPIRPPRKIQSLEQRHDIVVGPPRKKAPVAKAPSAPYDAKVHVLAPGHFVVKSDNPRMNIELRADVTIEHEEELTLNGQVVTVRGQIEPIGGRVFDIKRGRVQFTGGTIEDAVLEVQAVYDNPAAKVTVAVTGTVEKPEVKLTSEPPMAESQIALLIATGHTDLKAGSGGVGTLAATETGTAALGAVATQLFRDVVADKLPVDTVSLDSSQLRAGKYVTDKIYVGYTRRFYANPEQGENTNEVRVEYQITPHWTFESRYGDAQTGGASLIWSKDY